MAGAARYQAHIRAGGLTSCSPSSYSLLPPQPYSSCVGEGANADATLAASDGTLQLESIFYDLLLKQENNGLKAGEEDRIVITSRSKSLTQIITLSLISYGNVLR
jgi:hypothetical protein